MSFISFARSPLVKLGVLEVVLCHENEQRVQRVEGCGSSNAVAQSKVVGKHERLVQVGNYALWEEAQNFVVLPWAKRKF